MEENNNKEILRKKWMKKKMENIGSLILILNDFFGNSDSYES